MNEIELFQKWIDECDNIVFFGGAGVSTESGIPDFRSQDGLYNQQYEYPPETILSHSFYYNNPEIFYRFYREKMLYLDAKPSYPHIFLKQLEDKGKLKAIVTQNIDGLHQMAGSKVVYELHGSILKNHCDFCHKPYSVNVVKDCRNIPYCSCGGMIKPDVVLYGEGLEQDIIHKSIEAIANADMLIIGGTSLNVYPAASFIDYYQGNKMVLINKSFTPKDNIADLVIHDGLGTVFSKINI